MEKKQDNFEFINGINFQEISSKPRLDIAAHFWEPERYEAFKICYQSMRIMDDLVDDRKEIDSKIPLEEQQKIVSDINKWIKVINGGKPDNLLQKQLIDTMNKFNVPSWPWISLSRAMKYDVENDGFRSMHDFIKYSEGAAVAPGAVFIHFCTINKIDGDCKKPNFSIKNASRPVAIFSYLVHIIRDFQKDHINNLNYFPENLLKKFDLNRQTLKEIAINGKVTPTLRKVFEKYYNLIGTYQRRARNMIDEIGKYVEPRYRLSLEIVYSLYSQVFERMNIRNGTFTNVELNPSTTEIKDRIYETITHFKKQVF